MKALDFVRTPSGGIGMVTETNNSGTMASINFIGKNSHGEKNAWWREGDGLIVIDSLPRLLSEATAHPFGRGRDDVKEFFGDLS